MRCAKHRSGPGQEIDPTPLQALRLLAAISLLLALATLGLAVAWSREHAEALCWRAAAEDNQIPAEGDCHRPLKAGPLTLRP